MTLPSLRLPQRSIANVNRAASPLTAVALPGSMPRPGSSAHRTSKPTSFASAGPGGPGDGGRPGVPAAPAVSSTPDTTTSTAAGSPS